MKVLHTIASLHPPTGGMQEVIRQISKRLVSLGNEVTIATSMIPVETKKLFETVKIVEFDITGNFVNGISGGGKEKYKKFLIGSDFDVITNFAAQHWATDLMLPILNNIKAKKVFVPTGFSALFKVEYKEYFEYMKKAILKYDMNVFLSENYRDINFAKDCGVKKMLLIPNGAAADEFLEENDIDIRETLSISGGNFFILHVSSHTGLKGHQEAIQIFKKAQIKNSSFVIVGSYSASNCQKECNRSAMLFNYSPKRLIDGKKIIIASLSRAETVAAFKDADLFLFPSNIECSPIVLFECMASNTPFLTTDVGNAREIIKWGNSGMLLPTIIESNGLSRAKLSESANMMECLYRDTEKREEMKTSGFKAWSDHFSWEKIALKYESLYKQLINNETFT